MRAYIQVLDYCQKHSTSWQELQPAFQQHGIDLAGLMADAELQQAALTALDDETGWTLIRDDGLRLLHKHESGSPVHSFKGECTLEVRAAWGWQQVLACNLCSPGLLQHNDTGLLYMLAGADASPFFITTAV